MIKIPPIDDDCTSDYRKDTFTRIKSFLCRNLTTEKYLSVIRYLSTGGNLDDDKIERLLIGGIDELIAAIRAIGKIENEAEDKGFHRLYKNFTSRNLGKAWAEKIGVKICPYCNRSYVYTLSEAGVRPQYDHYFPKFLYPYLALSMYNLIPCCAICNGAKHKYDTFDDENDVENFIYPYRDDYGTTVHFRTSNEGDLSAWLGNSDNFELKIIKTPEIEPGLSLRVTNAITQLHLMELFGKHKDYVQDIIRTVYIFNTDYIRSLVDSYPTLFENIQEAENLVYMNYLEHEHWDQRILSKLTYDVKMEYQT